MKSKVAFYVLVLLFFSTARALTQNTATLTVNTGAGSINANDACPFPRDSGVYTSLQKAIDCSASGDAITLGIGVYAEPLRIQHPLHIQGFDRTLTILAGVDAQPAIIVDTATDVLIEDLTITGGAAATGGGVQTIDSTVTLDNVLIENNSASTVGGGIYSLGGTVTIVGSIIRNNSASVDGGGIYTQAGTFYISATSIYDNVATADGGGIYTEFGTLIIENTTISNNSATTGTQVYNSAGHISTSQTTIAATTGDTIVNYEGVFALKTSLVSGPAASVCNGIFESLSYNLLQAVTLPECEILGDTTGNIIGQDPQLEPQVTAGAAVVRPLAIGSPAVDSIATEICTATSDHRGFARPQDGNLDGTSFCDIGAYELTVTDLELVGTVDVNQPIEDELITYTFDLTNQGTATDNVSVSLVIPAGLTAVASNPSIGGLALLSDELLAQLEHERQEILVPAVVGESESELPDNDNDRSLPGAPPPVETPNTNNDNDVEALPVELTWDVGTLANSGLTSLTLVAQPNSNTANQNLTVTAEVASSTLVDIDSTPANEVSSEDDFAQIDVAVQESADVSIAGVVSDTEPVIDTTVTYTLTITNNGPYAATTFVVEPVLPAGLTLQSSTPTLTNNQWEITELALGNSQQLTLTALVASDVEGQTLDTNFAIISTAKRDPNTGNDDVLISVLALGQPDIAATVFTATDQWLNASGMVDFTVLNQGGSDTGTFDLSVYYMDELAACATGTSLYTETIFNLASGESLSRSLSLGLDKAAFYVEALASDAPNQASGTMSAHIDYLCLVVDTEDMVVESNESNNSGQGEGYDSDDITYFPWDLDGNGVVESADVDYLNQRLGTSDTLADMNGDGLVTPTESIAIVNRLTYVININVVQDNLPIPNAVVGEGDSLEDDTSRSLPDASNMP